MSFNGAGVFSITSTGQPVSPNTSIDSTVHNALTADLATGLSTCIAKDGQSTTTASIPFAAGISVTGAAALDSLQCNSIVDDTGLAANLYTPTFTNVTNIASKTLVDDWLFIRVGNVVQVAGGVLITPTAGASATVLAFSLPVASNLTNTKDCSGVGTNASGNCGFVDGDTTNNRAQYTYTSEDTSSHLIYVSFMYRVI